MKSMKITQDDRKKMEKKYETPMVEESYPYGLEVNLDEHSIEKLGLDELPEVGSQMMIMAKVDVTSVSDRKGRTGQNRSINLQITEMELSKVEEKKSTEETLYGG